MCIVYIFVFPFNDHVILLNHETKQNFQLILLRFLLMQKNMQKNRRNILKQEYEVSIINDKNVTAIKDAKPADIAIFSTEGNT